MYGNLRFSHIFSCGKMKPDLYSLEYSKVISKYLISIEKFVNPTRNY